MVKCGGTFERLHELWIIGDRRAMIIVFSPNLIQGLLLIGLHVKAYASIGTPEEIFTEKIVKNDQSTLTKKWPLSYLSPKVTISWSFSFSFMKVTFMKCNFNKSMFWNINIQLSTADHLTAVLIFSPDWNASSPFPIVDQLPGSVVQSKSRDTIFWIW